MEWVAAGASITGSFWGEPEAGIVGQQVFARPDTPVHSLLHEVCHIICVTPERRAVLEVNAGWCKQHGVTAGARATFENVD